MIVVDTNIISYFFINGEFTDLAEKAFKKNHYNVPASFPLIGHPLIGIDH